MVCTTFPTGLGCKEEKTEHVLHSQTVVHTCWIAQPCQQGAPCLLVVDVHLFCGQCQRRFYVDFVEIKEEYCPRSITCSGSFYGSGQGCCRFSDSSRGGCEMMPSSFEGTKAVTDHFKLTRSGFFVSEVRDFTSLNLVFRLTHNVRTMTTPLKDSVESLRYLESVVSQSGVYDTCGDPAVMRLAWNRCPPGRHPGGCGGRGVGVHGGRVVQDGHVHVS